MYESAGIVPKATPNATIAKTLNLGGAVVTVWALFFPRPYDLVIVLLVGFFLITCMIFFQSNGSYEIAGLRYDPRPSLAIAFGGCSVALMIRSIRDLPLLSFAPTVLMAVVGGLVLTIIVADVDRKARESGKFQFGDQKLSRRLGFFAGVLIFTISYSFGATVQANALLDKSVPVTYRVVVLRKSVYNDRRVTDWELWLAPWGPREEAKSVSVASSLYRSVAPGQSVCVDLHGGALKIPWYVVKECH
jgi:hypothetical protein